MQRWKRLFYYLLINVIVSACTMFVVLKVWERVYYPGLDVFATISEAPIEPTIPVVSVTSPPTTPSATIPRSTPLALQAYTVKPGDSLGLIADLFDTTVEEIMTINGLNDPNSLGSGLVLYVPAPAETPSLETPVSQAEGEPLPTATSSGSSDSAATEIVNVMSAGDLESERVQLQRTGEGVLEMTGWRLQDEDGNVYVFPQLTLYTNGAVNVHTRTGEDTVVDLFWRRSESVWQTGEIVTLLDDQGVVQATFEVP